MKQATVIFEQGEHRWYVIARDPERHSTVIDTNEYLVTFSQEAGLLDPGGIEIFPAVFSALCEIIDPRQIKWLFSSHQDPDIISSLALWMDVNPEISCHVSWLWGSFLPHFGGSQDTIITIPDEGNRIPLGNGSLQSIPAHYLHSSGNFHLYDEKARILFSGDVGAALLPDTNANIYVQNFDQHIRYAEAFHKRWMGSNEAKQDWCQRVSQLKIDMLCPQHGAIYQGQDVQRFINWFAELKVGSGIK